MDITNLVEDLLLNKEKPMNNVNVQDVTFMSLALGFFSTAGVQLVDHDYYVAGGLAVLGVVLVYLYHKLGTPTAK